MRYVSTRGGSPAVGFADTLVGGVAPDGGLWVPNAYPEIQNPPGAPYADVAAAVVAPYVDIDMADLRPMVDDAYATFDHPEVCPLRRLDAGVWLLELFHGPTLAFKDVALQLLGRLLDAELQRRRERATILVATSGDTGSAAIAGCVGREALDIVVLHPAGRISEVQRRQMTTVDAPNVHNLAVDGTFDDCQALVKVLLAEEPLRTELRLAAMNSINWTRVAAQAAYYAWACGIVGPARFAVPSGNFGNALAGWVAARMGAPVEGIIVGTGRNDLLYRWLTTGVIEPAAVVPTVAPAMDVQVPSNVERLLFELVDRDPEPVVELLERLRSDGRVDAPRHPLFTAERFDDDQIRAMMASTCRETGVLVDPHTAVALGAARASDSDGPVVAVATAHPAKFPDTVVEATGQMPEVPERLGAAMSGTERYEVVANDLDEVRRFVRRSVGAEVSSG